MIIFEDAIILLDEALLKLKLLFLNIYINLTLSVLDIMDK